MANLKLHERVATIEEKVADLNIRMKLVEDNLIQIKNVGYGIMLTVITILVETTIVLMIKR